MSESLSVVVPVFNEAPILEELVLQLEREVVAAVAEVEVIVIDDCSSDATPEILRRLAEARRWLRVHRTHTNRGHGESVASGLDLARGDWIFQLDSDGQFLVSEFHDLWRRRHGADLVLGVRAERRDPRHRLVLSQAVRLTVSALAMRPLRDPNTPFRLVRASLWRELRSAIAPRTLAPAILVVLGAAARRRRVVEVPVTHLPRTHGASSLRSLRLLRFSLRGLGQLLRFRYTVVRAHRGDA